jgi:site-specific recombinase XerD
VQAGIDIKSVTEMLGHEDIRTTLQHYAKTSSESLLDASQKLVDALKNSSISYEEIIA